MVTYVFLDVKTKTLVTIFFFLVYGEELLESTKKNCHTEIFDRSNNR